MPGDRWIVNSERGNRVSGWSMLVWAGWWGGAGAGSGCAMIVAYLQCSLLRRACYARFDQGDSTNTYNDFMKPFVEYEDYFFRPYGASGILRKIFLNLYNDANPLELGRIRSLDEEHYKVAMECIDEYWRRGEAAPGFHDLAQRIIAGQEK